MYDFHDIRVRDWFCNINSVYIRNINIFILNVNVFRFKYLIFRFKMWIKMNVFYKMLYILKRRNIYIYIYIYIYCIYIYTVYISAVKICALTQATDFFQFNTLKIFTPINAGAELGLATPLTTAVSVIFFLLTRSAFIQSQNVFTKTSNGRRFRHVLQLHFSGRSEQWSNCKKNWGGMVWSGGGGGGGGGFPVANFAQ